MSRTFQFQTIQFGMSIQFQCQKLFYFKQFTLAKLHSLQVQTVVIQTIQFSISTKFSSIWVIDRTLSVATTSGQRWPGSDGNGRIFRIFQSPNVTGISPSDCSLSYSCHSLRGLISVEKERVYLLLQHTVPGKIRRKDHKILNLELFSI